MQDTPEISQFESLPDIQKDKSTEQKEKEKSESIIERGEDLEERKGKQDRHDEDRIEEIRDEMTRKANEQETPPPKPTQLGDLKNKMEQFEQEMRSFGFEKSAKYGDSEVEELEREVIGNLNETFPGYNIDTRLAGAESSTFIADRTSFNEFALRHRFPNMGERWVQLLKHLPIPAAGFAFGDQRSVVNGGLPKFLVKRTMYHEDLHLASAGLLHTPINEGATEYYARQAATKEGFAQNVMNPFYFPNAVTYALMSRVVGEDVAKEAYFNGQIGEFQLAVDTKWGEDSYLKINRLSHGFFGVRAAVYSAFKWSTRR